MLPRHRRRFGSSVTETDSRPRLPVRLAFAVVFLIIAWYAVSWIFSLFDGSSGLRTPVVLSAAAADSVQVSLQDAQWQKAESGLKLYAGDSISTKGNSTANLMFFDGTRIRLDQNTEATVEESSQRSGGDSALSFRIKSGRIWISTPDTRIFSGAIIRTVVVTDFSARVPADSALLVSPTLLNVVRASGQGIPLSLTFGKDETVIIGEGQTFELTDEAKTSILSGKDPYDFRDPVTQKLLRDEFLVSSFVAQNDVPSAVTDAGSSSSAASGAVLTMTSPDEGARITTKTVTIRGTVGEGVASLVLNGQTVSIASKGSFVAELSLDLAHPTTLITLQAEDKQGIIIAELRRTVTNAYAVNVAPLRIKSPVGSGETLTTNAAEVEITGEAPAGTAGVLVNDYRLQLYKSGAKTWSYLASAALGNLKLGPNVFTVTAVDADGNKSPGRSITIVLTEGAVTTGSGASVSSTPLKQNAPLTPGVLKVTSPVAGTNGEVTVDSVSILGETSPETASISVNGYTLSLYKAGTTGWKYVASVPYETMKRGKNVYRIVARNASGEVLDILEYTLTYRP